MGVGKLNIWVSDVADPCGTWNSRDEKTSQRRMGRSAS